MEKEYPPFEYGIARILDCGFSLEEGIDVKSDNIQYGYGMNFIFSVEESWIQFVIRTDFKDGTTKNSFLTGTVLTKYSINNLSAFVDDNQTVQFPSGSLETLFGMAFTHMRAIISKNIAGSKFSWIVVPIVNPNTLFPELLRINVEKFKEFTASINATNSSKSETDNFKVKKGKPATNESKSEIIAVSAATSTLNFKKPQARRPTK